MTAPAKSTLEILGTPLAALTGVTPQIAECFQRLGLRSVLDLLFYFPRDYEDFTDLRAIKSLEHDAVVSVAGTVTDLELRRSRRPVLGVLIEDGTGALRAMWFNQPYMHLKFAMGQRVLFSGKVALKGGRWQMAHPRVQWLDNDEAAAGGKILPIYSLTEGLAQWHVRRAMVTALDLAADLLDEVFPAEFLAAHNLGPIRGAIRRILYPGDQESLAVARRRFVFQELFILQLALAVRRQRMRVLGEAPSLEATARIDARIRRLLPFELTEGQKQAIAEISDDLKRPFPTNRLLQGDVGSGKTVVAVYAMLLTVAHGYQAALMAPTEILARQHAATFGRLLAAGRVRIGLLTGGLTTSERTELRAKIAAGEIDLVIGTHAVVQEDVEFAKLGLALEAVTVQNVSLPEELQKILDQKIGMGMVGNDMGKFMQYQTAQAIPKFAEGAAGAGGGGGGVVGDAMGLGAGVALGQVMAQQLQQGLQGGAAQAAGAAAQSVGVRPDEVMATIEKLAELKTKGILTAEEFDAKKAELLKKLV